MQLQINVNIKAGTRTETEICVTPRGLTPKVVKFKNGDVMDNYFIARMIHDFLMDKLGVTK